VLEYQLGQAGTPTIFAVAAPGVRSLGYALLARHLGEKQPFYKLQAAGPIVQGRPLKMGELRSLAQQYIAGMRSVQPEGPYFIAAMCGGCQIAEQMILQLESLGHNVTMFAIFDTWVMEHAHTRWGWVMFGAEQRLRWLRRTSWQDGVKWFGKATKNRFAEWTGKVKPNRPWTEAYWPQGFQTPRFKAPVILFKRPKQPYFYVADPLMGWGARSEGGVTTYEISADHHEVLREPHVRFVSRVLQAQMQESVKAAPEVHVPNALPAVAT
jgi:aspartate racemase